MVRGGTVNFATVHGARHVLAPGEAGFEDGTLNFLGIPAVEIGLRRLGRIGMEVIQTRVACLTDRLLARLLSLRHSNGRAMVRLYGPASTIMRGGTVTMNFYDPDGHLIDYRRIDELAGQQGISLRTGCFCNPGAGEWAEGLTEDDMLAGLSQGLDITLPLFLQIVQRRGKSAGAIRVSLGLVSNFADVERFVEFASGFRDQTALTIGAVSFDIELPGHPRRRLRDRRPVRDAGPWRAARIRDRVRKGAPRETHMPVQLHHVNLRTTDLERTIAFYTEAIGLTNGWRPDFGFPRAWLYDGARPAVHVNLVSEAAQNADNAIDHVAFAFDALDPALARLDRLNLSYTSPGSFPEPASASVSPRIRTV